MTDITLDRAQTEIPNVIIKATSMLFIIIGLAGAGSLLKWAVTDKLARTELIEDSKITAAVRERQLGCLAKNIYHEAGGEPFEGKVGVAQVTLNRMKSGLFPNDVCQVIYQKNVFYEKVVCQFSWVCERETAFRPVNQLMYNESMNVAKKVLLENYRLPGLTQALFYHADYVNPKWNKEKIAQIGRHIFYK